MPTPETSAEITPVAFTEAKKAFNVRAGVGRQPIQPGLEDTVELVEAKEKLDLLGFKAVMEPGAPEVHVYPDANGSGVLTRREIEGLLSSPQMASVGANGTIINRWPLGKKAELEAMLAPDNPSVLVAETETASQQALNITNHMPRVVRAPRDNQNTLNAKWSFTNTTWTKAITSSQVGNRYISSDLNRDNVVTVSELKAFYNHPETQGKIPLRHKCLTEMNIARYSGTLDKTYLSKFPSYFTKDVFHNNTESGKYFAANGKYPEELQGIADKALTSALTDSSKGDALVYSLSKFETMVRSMPPRKPRLASSFPTSIEQYDETDVINESQCLNERLIATEKFVQAPLPSFQLTTLDRKPDIGAKEGETVEDFLARKEFHERAWVPVNMPQGQKQVYLDHNMDGVVKQQEVMDVLNYPVPAGRGARIADILPEATRSNLLSAANNSQVVPASLEKLKETMKEKVFDVKEGASNEAYLKVLDVDANKVVTIGELKYKQNQVETKIQTAQTK